MPPMELPPASSGAVNDNGANVLMVESFATE
jgi:hypothetical protein